MFKNLCCKNTVQYIYSYVTRACDLCLNLSSAVVEWENLAFRKLQHRRSQASDGLLLKITIYAHTDWHLNSNHKRTACVREFIQTLSKDPKLYRLDYCQRTLVLQHSWRERITCTFRLASTSQ